MKDLNRNYQIGKSALTLANSQIISLLLGIIITMLMSRYITVNEYGTYSQLNIILNLSTMLIVVGIPNSIVYFLPQMSSVESKNKFLSTYFTITSILVVLLTVLLIIFSSSIIDFFNNNMIKKYYLYVIILPFFYLLQSSCDNVLLIENQIKYVSVLRIIKSAVTILGLFLIYSLSLDFYSILSFQVFVAIVFSILSIAKVIENGFRFKFYLDWLLIKSIYIYSLPIGFAVIVGKINITIDKLVISKLMSVNELALYQNASRDLPIMFLATSLTAVLMPRLVKMLSQRKYEKALLIWRTAILISSIVSFVLITGVIVYAKEVFLLLYSEKYIEGVQIFQIYNILLYFRIIYFGMILDANGKTKYILFSSLVSLILNLILNILLFKLLGIIGPAVGTVISQIVTNVLQLYFSKMELSVRWRDVFPIQEYFEIFVNNIFFGFAFFIIKNNIELESIIGDILESIILGIFWICIYWVFVRRKLRKLWKVVNEVDTP